MDSLLINGGKSLHGSVRVDAAKNASLPIMAATLLNKGVTRLTNLPALSDVDFFKKILTELGCEVKGSQFDGSGVDKHLAPYDLVRKMRASVLVLGPLLSRFNQAVVSLPGGCAIGSRPVDIHISALEKLGAQIEIKNGYIHAKTEGLVGAKVKLEFPSVGATENILMAAVYAKGTTEVYNYAKEPEVMDLIDFLIALGVEIVVSEEHLQIKGHSGLIEKDLNYEIIGDRIEAVSFAVAAILTEGQVAIEGFHTKHIEQVLQYFKNMGVKFEVSERRLEIFPSQQLKKISFVTEVYPGIPTDVQAQMMTLLGALLGECVVEETIFENRFMHVAELLRMGFDIEVQGSHATVKSPSDLTGAEVMCTDLRASAALVLAALVCKGETKVNRIYHLDRGYVRLEEKLSALGADIQRVKT